MNVCDNLGDHLVGNVYIKVRMCLQVGGVKGFVVQRLNGGLKA
jgi:hypothetical protein